MLEIRRESSLACSSLVPVCVGGERLSERMYRDSLRGLERAYHRLVLGMALPEPRRSDDGQPLTWIIDPRAAGPTRVTLRPNLGLPTDSAAAVCRSGSAPNHPFDVDREAHLCVGEAIAARLDPAEAPQLRRAFALALWWAVGTPRDEDVDGIARMATNTAKSPLGGEREWQSSGAALWLEYLDRTLSRTGPFALPCSLFALSAQRTPNAQPRFNNEPDILDVFSGSLEQDRRQIAQSWLAFAVARLLLAEGRSGLERLAWAGQLARIEPSWDLPLSSLPRRVATPVPIEPLGLFVVRVGIDRPTEHLSLGARMVWEPPAPFVWTIIKLDAKGEVLGRVTVAYQERTFEAERQILELNGVGSLLIVGTNLGGVDLSHSLDPDRTPYEAHGCTVYVTQL